MMTKKPVLQLYSEVNTNRFRFTASFLFKEVLGHEITFCYIESDVDPELPVVSYSHRPVTENSFHIRPVHLLKEKRIEEQQIEMLDWGNTKGFFPSDGVDIPFDVLSAAFYLITRYEEYLPHKTDAHKRFPPDLGLAFQHDFLHLPLIDLWAFKIDSALYGRFGIKCTRRFKFVNTIDVDSAYAFTDKGLFRTLGAFLKGLRYNRKEDIKNRFLTLFSKRKDPFDTFDYILETNKKYGFKSIFFFLLGDYGIHDKNIPYTGKRFRSLMKHVNDYSKVGIHPSYAASENPELLNMEIKRLNHVIHMPVERSRHHYIKMRLPHTYRDLRESDIRHDYTMGYASESGFRASTCTPFYFFDLSRNRTTALKVHPFCIMEATLKNYKNIPPENTFEYFKPYVDAVKKVEGTLYSVWHNDSLSEYGDASGWRKVYEQMLKYIAEVQEGDSPETG